MRWLPGLNEAVSPEATRKHLSYLLTLDLIRLQAGSLFEGLEKGAFGSKVNLYLFIVVGRLLCNRAEPVVLHLSGNRGRLSLVATADDLDASTLEPVEESFQGGAGHCADLVQDDHTGNELLPYPSRPPLRLATPSEEAVVGLGLDAPWSASLWPGDGLGGRRGDHSGGGAQSLAWFCRSPRRRLGSSSGASTAGRRGAARCWERGPFLCLLYNHAWRGRLHVPRACRAPRPYHAIGPMRPREGSRILFMGMKAATPSSLFSADFRPKMLSVATRTASSGVNLEIVERGLMWA